MSLVQSVRAIDDDDLADDAGLLEPRLHHSTNSPTVNSSSADRGG
jgi:hypothetical protein